MSGGLGPSGRDLSVMIPTFNCAHYLAQALISLRGQGIDGAQVVVVDDCSTADDPGDVVDAFGGPAKLFRQPRNVGVIANFNTCLRLAERRWVHVLHGDDFVLHGAYATIDDVLVRHRQSQVVLARSVIVDEHGVWQSTTPRLGPGTDGPLTYDPLAWSLTPVQFAGVVFSNEAAASLNGFDPALPHVADWDLWWRLVRSAPAAYTNRCVGAYRQFEGNDSSRLHLTAANIDQGLAQLARVMDADGMHDDAMFDLLLAMATNQAYRFAGQTEPFLAQLRVMRKMPWRVRRGRVAKLLATHLKRRATRRR